MARNAEVVTTAYCPYCNNMIRVAILYKDLDNPVVVGCNVGFPDEACGKEFLVVPYPRLDLGIFKIEEVKVEIGE